ncbi:MAG: hypothetical protein L3J70_10085 [Gammaproteobacteria bacterium]|nr:hypothetical protein [Gammaproteobacteria bacterium]
MEHARNIKSNLDGEGRDAVAIENIEDIKDLNLLANILKVLWAGFGILAVYVVANFAMSF